MILATVGTQLPFPRLIRLLDDLAPTLPMPVIAQIGANNGETPRNIEHHVSFEPRQFDALIQRADRLVAHAGIGTLLSAKRHGKPIIVFPRLARLGEHRNDHQMATAGQLEQRQGVHVAYDAEQLEALLRAPVLEGPSDEANPSIRSLQTAVRQFIAGTP